MVFDAKYGLNLPAVFHEITNLAREPNFEGIAEVQTLNPIFDDFQA